MDFVADGARRYEDLVAGSDGLVVCLDFDGTLAPIVDDPGEAGILPGTAEVLVDLAGVVAGIAVVTGRPVRQVLALGGLEEIGSAIGEQGRDLHVLGQYGNETWTSHEREVVSPEPPRALADFEERLPSLLADVDAADAFVEDKGLAVGVHTRRLPDPAAAFDRLVGPISDLAGELGLLVEPGRLVVEVRAPGMDKGLAVRRLVADLGGTAVCFVGDDLGDVAAFRAVRALREEGAVAGLLVCAGSEEESSLRPLADVVVDGPEGVQDFLRRLHRDVADR